MPSQNIRTNFSVRPEKNSDRQKNNAVKYKIIIAVLVIILFVSTFFAFFGYNTYDRQRVEQNVLDLYKIITGSDAEIVKTENQNGIYKMSIRFKDSSGRDLIQDIFVTLDGAYFTDRLVDLNLQKSLLKNQSSFAKCLSDRQVRILGLSSDAQTQAQMQILGAFSSSIYFDCGGENSAICSQLNINTYPVIFYNNSLVQGPQNLEWFGANLGCFMTENSTK